MSAKLIVHKYVSSKNNNFKSLYITIKESSDEHTPAETIFGEWEDGKCHKKNKEPSRLVVKAISNQEFSLLNLDSCAAEIKMPEKQVLSELEKQSNILVQYNQESKKTQGSFSNDESHQLPSYQQRKITNFCENSEGMNPLESSLEKVKENNARIMENIHMLNRTLNYTKKKEILNIVCPKAMRPFPCNTCGKCFVYETGLKRHNSMRHTVAEIQPRWQVVWTCIECFQVWPRQELAVAHSNQCCKSNKSDCVREIKTSSLLQCEFCEKVYTSIPRLLRHSKVHMTKNNYECNTCDLAFVSYKAAEQHWQVCPWLKMCYTFFLPKLLLCNACDRKFRNYEQLYNHRYKVGHFMTKTHINQISSKSLGFLVYQCEMCGQWFTSIQPLQAHRNQYHPRYETGIIKFHDNNDYENECQNGLDHENELGVQN